MSTDPTAEEASQTPRPMGQLLETPTPPFPPPTTLEGRACTLTPLSTTHYPLLHKALCLPPAPPGLWDYMLRGPFPEFAEFEDAMNSLVNNDRDSKQYFVISTDAGDGGERPGDRERDIRASPAADRGGNGGELAAARPFV
ncbi:hypothetical protein V499_03590 [Pseudogymnoascus sp. VKM F-103]|nr:hypothetical protein V499_03590 [Pseudogymnoascus sp. VKM F-103]